MTLRSIKPPVTVVYDRGDSTVVRPDATGLFRLFLVASAITALHAGTASAQTAIVKGVVVERGSGEPLNLADIELAGSPRAVTNPRGEFVFPNVKPGRRKLTVKLLGYRDYQTTLEIKGDLEVRVELEIEAVPVRGVAGGNRNYTIRGEVTEKASGDPVIDAETRLGTNRRTATNMNGNFKFSKVRVGQPVVVLVRAIGMMPADLQVDAEADTTLQFHLVPDPIGQGMLAQQVARLEKRTNGIGQSVQTIGRETLVRSNETMYDLVRRRLQAYRRGLQCLFIDERISGVGIEELMLFLPQQVERVEFIDRGKMVRVYARRYVEDMMLKRAHPMAIVFIETPNGTTCK